MKLDSIDLDLFATEPERDRPRGGCGACGAGTTPDNGSRCGNGLEKIYPTTAVRFGYMRYIGEFTHTEDLRFTCGAKVIVQTKRGIEMGDQVSLTCNGCSKAVTRAQMKEWVDTCGHDSFIFEAGRILREATAADLAEYSRIQAAGREKRDFCQELADKHKLPMRIVECECPFGGERIIYYFTAAERVDFRGLVKDLAREYRTRIEMRQVGARDEARLLADFESCGREVCCKVFLKTLKPISMRMAKLQKSTLDPSQVSGRCGRLKCCLRYEHVGYEELDKGLPRVGVRVRTSHGDGVIVNRQILTQLLQIRDEADHLVTVVAEDILEVNVKEAAPKPPPRDRTEQPESNVRPAKKKTGRPTVEPVKGPPSPPEDRRTGEPKIKAEGGEASDVAAPKLEKEGDRSPSSRRRRRRSRRRRPRGDGNTGGRSGSPPKA